MEEFKSQPDDISFEFLRPAAIYRSIDLAPAPQSQLNLDQPVYRGVGAPEEISSFATQGGTATRFGSDFWQTTGSQNASQAKNAALEPGKSLSELIPMPALGQAKLGKPNLAQANLSVALGAFALAPAVRRAPVPPLPVWIEPNSSFSTTNHDVLDQICNLLEKEHIHHNYKPHKNKIKGVVFENEVSSQFVIQLYAKDVKVNVVEFQRKSGCVLVFNRLYRRVHNAVTGTKVQPSAPAVVFEPPASPFLDAASTADHSCLDAPVKLDGDTLSTLVSLAASPCTDVQRDAARTVANLSACPANARVLAESVAASAPSPLSPTAVAPKASFVDLLQQLLASKDREVARCASVLAANLSKEEAARGVLVTKLLGGLLRLLDANVDSGSIAADTSRQCAVALENLASSHAPQMVQQLQRAKGLKPAVNTLAAMQNSKDRICRHSAGQALNRLVLVGVVC